MKRDLYLFIKDILYSIKLIENYSKGLTKEKFEKTKRIQDAITRRMEIIGEAVKNIPDSYRDKYPQISWKKIAGLRDIIIHTYFNIDLDITWDIIKNDFPKLKKDIERILELESKGELK